jgi:hypothetical protein
LQNWLEAFAQGAKAILVQRGFRRRWSFVEAQGKDGPRFDNQSPQATLAVLEAMRFTDGGGASPIPDIGTADREFILTMLASTRSERPRRLTPVPAGATDARFFRVMSTQGRDCLRLTAN